MKRTIPLLISLALGATAAYADGAPDMLKAKGCLGCHQPHDDPTPRAAQLPS